MDERQIAEVSARLHERLERKQPMRDVAGASWDAMQQHPEDAWALVRFYCKDLWWEMKGKFRRLFGRD